MQRFARAADALRLVPPAGAHRVRDVRRRAGRGPGPAAEDHRRALAVGNLAEVRGPVGADAPPGPRSVRRAVLERLPLGPKTQAVRLALEAAACTRGIERRDGRGVHDAEPVDRRGVEPLGQQLCREIADVGRVRARDRRRGGLRGGLRRRIGLRCPTVGVHRRSGPERRRDAHGAALVDGVPGGRLRVGVVVDRDLRALVAILAGAVVTVPVAIGVRVRAASASGIRVIPGRFGAAEVFGVDDVVIVAIEFRDHVFGGGVGHIGRPTSLRFRLPRCRDRRLGVHRRRRRVRLGAGGVRVGLRGRCPRGLRRVLNRRETRREACLTGRGIPPGCPVDVKRAARDGEQHNEDPRKHRLHDSSSFRPPLGSELLCCIRKTLGHQVPRLKLLIDLSNERPVRPLSQRTIP